MLIAVLVLALVALVLLGASIITGNTILALVVIGLAAIGLVLLARDSLRERRSRDTGSAGAAEAEPSEDGQAAGHEKHPLEADLFEPDVSYEEAVAEEHRGARGEKNVE